jgi:hypothetical protein
MELKEFEQVYGDFYVPTFVIKVGGQDLVRDLFLTVSAVSIDLKEKAAGHFSFTVASVFDWEAREFVAMQREERVDLLELFAFGSPVEISVGYGEPARLEPMLTGLVTEIATSFGSGGAPELTISGYDGLYPLTIGKSTRHWEGSRDSDAVSDVAGLRGLSSDIRQTDPVKPRIDQNEETDMAFVEKMAERNGATFYMRDDRLYFGPRRNDTSEVVSLVWGEGLVGFAPEANLARQISEVEVHGWSAANGEAIVGRARRGDESGRDTRAESGADRVVTALSDTPVLKVRAAVHTQAEADARAQAILEERAQEFVTGNGECIGVPDIVPDVNIALGGMGRGFSKTYYVSEATHSIEGNGYRTTFKVQETTV